MLSKGAHLPTGKRPICAQDPRLICAQESDSPAHRKASMRLQPFGVEITETRGGTGEQGEQENRREQTGTGDGRETGEQGHRETGGTGATGKGSWEKATFRSWEQGGTMGT